MFTLISSGKTKNKSLKIGRNFTKKSGLQAPPKGRRPGAVAPPRAMVDPPLNSAFRLRDAKSPDFDFENAACTIYVISTARVRETKRDAYKQDMYSYVSAINNVLI